MSGPVSSGYDPTLSPASNDFPIDASEPKCTPASGPDSLAQPDVLGQQSALGPWASSGAGAYTRAFAPMTPDPAATAARVMDVGDEWGTDDYDARLVALTKELGKGDASYRAQLMSEIFKRDPNAMGSWLQPERANDLRQSGRISMDEKAALAEGVAAAYNRGTIPQHDLYIGTTPKTGEDGRVMFSPLDNAIAGADVGEPIERAQRMREFIEFFGASKGPEVTGFRQKYAEHLLAEYVLDPALSYHRPVESDAAASLAANLLGGDLSRPELATNGLAKYDAGQIKTIMEAATRSDTRFGEEALRVPARDRMLNARDNSVPDGAQLLILGVGQTHSAQGDRIAVDFARMASLAPKVFEGELGKDRVDALTLAVASHSKPVLDALTQYTDKGGGDYVGNEKNTTVQRFMLNASDLGTLFKTTLLNPDSTYSATLEKEVVSYASGLATTINTPGPNKDDVQRLAMLQAGLTDGVRQGFEQLASDQAKAKEAVSFLLDLAISAVPLGKLTSEGVQKALTDAFGDSPRFQAALQAPLDKLIDTGSGKLTDAGKKALLEGLDTEHKGLEVARNAAERLNHSFMNQVSPQDYDVEYLDTKYQQILDGVTNMRQEGAIRGNK